MKRRDVDVLVIGGGPAGLAAGVELRKRGAQRVLVIEREEQAGGIPRHSKHTGFGVRDLHLVMTGPRYARHWVRAAQEFGVEIATETSATDWSGPRSMRFTSPDGRMEVTAEAVLLATGCRERPRSTRLLPGTRPLGVMTTGALQQAVYLHHQAVGRRAVIVGAEHVSFSAVMTLAHGGVSIAAMITDGPRHQTYWPLKFLTADLRRVPLLTRATVTNLLGRDRVEAVEVTNERDGERSLIECDTVVFTGDWIPDHEFARMAGLTMDKGTRGPRVDGALRTSTAGVFAAGNLLHGAETASIAALSGRHAAVGIAAFLETGTWPVENGIPVECEPPLRWVSPNVLTSDRPAIANGRFILRVSDFTTGQVVARQGDRKLWSGRRRRLVPNRSIHAPAGWVDSVDFAGPPVRFSLNRRA